MTLATVSLAPSRNMPRAEEVQRPEILPGKINPLTSEHTLAGRDVSVSEATIPPVARAILNPQQPVPEIVSKSDNLMNRATICFALAGLCAVLGHGFYIAAVVLFIVGVYFCVQSSRALDEADIALVPIESPKQDKFPKEIPLLQGAKIDKLLEGKATDILEGGEFTSGQLSYTVPGVGTSSDAIFKHFTKQAVGSVDPKVVQEDLSSKDHEIRKRARHICGFLKLLEVGNTPINAQIARDIAEKSIQVVEVAPGKLTTFLAEQIGVSAIRYHVEEAEVRLDRAEQQPVMRFNTSRTVIVFAPDQDGNVRYLIKRSFTPILRT